MGEQDHSNDTVAGWQRVVLIYEKTHSSVLLLTQPLQAFTEMQITKLETTKKINMIDMQCDMVKKGKHKYTLTEKGTSNLTDDTR